MLGCCSVTYIKPAKVLHNTMPNLKEFSIELFFKISFQWREMVFEKEIFFHLSVIRIARDVTVTKL